MKPNQKQGKFLKTMIILKNVKIYKIDPYSYEHYQKQIQVDNNGCKYILFRIDFYFSEYSLAVEIDEIGHTGRDFIFEKKKTKTITKKTWL